MESKAIIFVTSSIASLGLISFYYFFKWQQNNQLRITQKIRSHESSQFPALGSLTHDLAFNQEKLTVELASCIHTFLLSSDFDLRQKLLALLHQASSFHGNFRVMRESRCLDTVFELLDSTTSSPSVQRQNLIILQIATNVACDQQCLRIIEKYLDEIVAIADTRTYSDDACVALQALGNVALTHAGCISLKRYFNRICMMLDTRDPYLLRNVLTILLNISCDEQCCNLLRFVEVPENFLNTISFAFSTLVPPVISSKMAAFLRNVYSVIAVSPGPRSYDNGRKSLMTFLQDSRSQVKSYLLPVIASSEEQTELHSYAQSLCNVLNDKQLPVT